MHYQFTSIDRIFTKLRRDVTPTFDEDDVIERTGEALEAIGAPNYYEDAVAFIEVANHQCPAPLYMHSVTQIARNNRWTPTNKSCVTLQTVVEETDLVFQNCGNCSGVSNCDSGYVVLDGKGSPLVEYDVAYYRPYFDLLGEYYGWCNSRFYYGNYSPVRLANSSFFDSVVDPKFDGSLYDNCKDEYKIIRGGTLRFSFKEGSVAVAYKRQVLDHNTGYPMIPDNISYTTAIVEYIRYKMLGKTEYGSNAHSKAESDWQWYCKQAGNVDMMPFGEDENQNLLDQRTRMIPNDTRYYGYFGNLSRPEYRKFNDPDHRNRNQAIHLG